MQDKIVNKSQMQTILDNRPKGVPMDDIIKAYTSNGYKVEGINYTPEPQKKSLTDKLSERASTFGSEVTLKPSRDMLVADANTTGQDRELAGLASVNRALQSPIRAVGAVGGAIGDVVGAGLEATGVDKIIGGAISPVVESGKVQQAMAAYKTLPQETQEVLGAIVNTANIPLAGTGVGLAKSGVEAGLKTTGAAAGKVAAKVAPTTEKATANTYKGIMDVVENKKSLLNSFQKSEGTGKDPIRVIAENPDYLVKINSEAKTIDAADAITNMKRDIEEYSTIRDNVLATADQTLPAVPTNQVIRDVSTKFNSKNYKTYLDEGEKAVKEVVTKLRTLKKLYPENVSRLELNEVRKGLDETINSFTDTKLKDRMRADLRTVFKETLEASIPESGLLKELNAKIGDIIDASKFAETKLNGTKVKGGGLTDLAMKATGANIGAAGAGGVFGGIPGAVAGYAISDFLSKQLIKNAINNPFDRAVLEKLKQARPDVVKRAEEYIKSTSPERTSKVEASPKLLQQSSGNSTTNPIKGKGIRGMVDMGEIKKAITPTTKKAYSRDAVGKFSEENAIKNIKTVMKKPFTEELNDTIINNSSILKNPRVSKNSKDTARQELADTLKGQGLFDYEGKLTAKDDKVLIKIADEAGSFSDELEMRAKAVSEDTVTQEMMRDRLGQ